MDVKALPIYDGLKASLLLCAERGHEVYYEKDDVLICINCGYGLQSEKLTREQIAARDANAT